MINAWGVEPYLGYRFYDFDTGTNNNGLDLKDIHGFTIGARMMFDLTMQ